MTDGRTPTPGPGRPTSSGNDTEVPLMDLIQKDLGKRVMASWSLLPFMLGSLFTGSTRTPSYLQRTKGRRSSTGRVSHPDRGVWPFREGDTGLIGYQ